MKIPSLEDSIERMKQEILEDVQASKVPRDITCFSDLDFYADANAYGGFCEDELSEAMIAHYGGRDAHEGMPEGMLRHIHNAQTAVDEWIELGGILKATF